MAPVGYLVPSFEAHVGQSWESPPFKYTTAYAAIESIRYVRTGQFYDLHVPGPENYLAEGVFHHNTGKDFTTGRLVLWWMVAHYPAKVVVTGPTARQVDDIVWNELRYAYNNARHPIGGRLFDRPRLYFDEQHFALGFSTDNPYSLQGYHSPNLLVVVTEAHAMKAADITALRRLNPKCFIMTGNPFATSGEFYDSHHSMRELYYTVQMSAFDTPNLAEDAPEGGLPQYPGMVTKSDVAQRLEEWGEDNVLYQAGVLGIFPDSLDDSIVPLYAADMAVKRETATVDDRGNPLSVILACDVARFGRDKTVVVARQGGVARIIWRVQGRDTMQIAGWINAYVSDQAKIKDSPKIEYVIIDDTGVGGGVTDRLRELGLPGTSVRAFNGGASANDTTRYVNATSEAWMEMRKWFLNEEADIENDRALMAQLTSRSFTYQSDKRIQIESKTKMEKSPDEADALAMTFARGLGAPRLRILEW